MEKTFDYDEKESKKTERSNLAPEVLRQRMCTLEVLSPRVGESQLWKRTGVVRC